MPSSIQYIGSHILDDNQQLDTVDLSEIKEIVEVNKMSLELKKVIFSKKRKRKLINTTLSPSNSEIIIENYDIEKGQTSTQKTISKLSHQKTSDNVLTTAEPILKPVISSSSIFRSSLNKNEESMNSSLFLSKKTY